MADCSILVLGDRHCWPERHAHPDRSSESTDDPAGLRITGALRYAPRCLGVVVADAVQGDGCKAMGCRQRGVDRPARLRRTAGWVRTTPLEGEVGLRALFRLFPISRPLVELTGRYSSQAVTQSRILSILIGDGKVDQLLEVSHLCGFVAIPSSTADFSCSPSRGQHPPGRTAPVGRAAEAACRATPAVAG